MTRSKGTILLYALSLAVAAYAVVGYVFFPPGHLVHPSMQASFEARPVALYLHVFGAAVALVLGPFQFSGTLRGRHPRLHRWMGRAYLAFGVLAGGVAGLCLAGFAYGGAVSQAGFGLLALAWLGSGALAFGAIRRRDMTGHRRWMVRNFALTFAAVTLRLYLPASVASGVAFDVAYPAIAWLCWVPNLIVAELLWNRGIPRRGPPPRETA